LKLKEPESLRAVLASFSILYSGSFVETASEETTAGEVAAFQYPLLRIVR